MVDGDRIGGYGTFGNLDYPECEWENPPENLRDEYGDLLYRWDGEKPVLDPIDPGPEVKEAKRVEKVKAKFEAELFDLVYTNKDDPAKLAKALTDRVKEIDAETAIKSITQKKVSK